MSNPKHFIQLGAQITAEYHTQSTIISPSNDSLKALDGVRNTALNNAGPLYAVDVVLGVDALYQAREDSWSYISKRRAPNS